jgi:hypothetical protein
MPTDSPTPETAEPQRVRLWVRALAWVIVITGIPAIGWMSYRVLAKGVWPDIFRELMEHPLEGFYRVVQVAAVIWLFPLFAFVALKGRAPRSWPGIRSAAWKVESTSRFAALLATIRSRR